MDKSEKYIRMCTGAQEIQRRWIPVYGDFFLGDNGRISCWLEKNPAEVRVRGGFKIDECNGVIMLRKCIWMPRQDQLIELAQVPGRSYDNVVLDFFNWAKRPYSNNGKTAGKEHPSMEQVWMAYVMHRKYFKKWTGGQWNKIN